MKRCLGPLRQLFCGALALCLLLCGCGDTSDRRPPPPAGDVQATGVESGEARPGRAYTAREMAEFAVETMEMLWAGNPEVRDRLWSVDKRLADSYAREPYLFGGLSPKNYTGDYVANVFENKSYLEMWRYLCQGNRAEILYPQAHGDQTAESQKVKLGLWVTDYNYWVQFAYPTSSLRTQGSPREEELPQHVMGASVARKRFAVLTASVAVDSRGELVMALNVVNSRYTEIAGISDETVFTGESSTWGLGRYRQAEELLSWEAFTVPNRENFEELADEVNHGEVVWALQRYLEWSPWDTPRHREILERYRGLDPTEQEQINAVLAQVCHVSMLPLQRRSGDGGGELGEPVPCIRLVYSTLPGRDASGWLYLRGEVERLPRARRMDRLLQDPHIGTYFVTRSGHVGQSQGTGAAPLGALYESLEQLVELVEA